MGNASSSHDDHPNEDDELDPFDGIDTLGYRVLGVQPNSPASHAGLVSFLDFLVGANQRMLLGSGEDLEEGEEYDDVDLPLFLEENKDKAVEFLVWNIKSQQQRLVQLTPSDNWGGAGLLGVTIRLDNYGGAEDRLIRVLSVESKSPADLAGLVPLKDFLLGTTHQTLDSPSTLAALLEVNEDRVVEVYVYNSDSDKVRVVAIMPTRSWGGGGLLGAEVGVGYLHRLPSSVRSTEGVSVERKVRYVGVGASNKHGGSSNNLDRQLPQLSSKGHEKAVLEMTPQLEMEAAPQESEEDDDSDVEDMTSVSLRSQRSIATDDDVDRERHAPKTPMTSIKPTRQQQEPESPVTPPTPAPRTAELVSSEEGNQSASEHADHDDVTTLESRSILPDIPKQQEHTSADHDGVATLETRLILPDIPKRQEPASPQRRSNPYQTLTASRSSEDVFSKPAPTDREVFSKPAPTAASSFLPPPPKRTAAT